jgi:hypothetical protein
MKKEQNISVIKSDKEKTEGHIISGGAWSKLKLM